MQSWKVRERPSHSICRSNAGRVQQCPLHPRGRALGKSPPGFCQLSRGSSDSNAMEFPVRACERHRAQLPPAWHLGTPMQSRYQKLPRQKGSVPCPLCTGGPILHRPAASPGTCTSATPVENTPSSLHPTLRSLCIGINGNTRCRAMENQAQQIKWLQPEWESGLLGPILDSAGRRGPSVPSWVLQRSYSPFLVPM